MYVYICIHPSIYLCIFVYICIYILIYALYNRLATPVYCAEKRASVGEAHIS